MFLIDACGPHFAKRYFVKDCNGRVWSKGGWSANRHDAELFATPEAAGERLHDLMVEQVPGELHRFLAPIVVEVKSEKPVDLDALKRWLDTAVEVWMDAQHGVGPGKCMVMMQLDWSQLKEKL